MNKRVLPLLGAILCFITGVSAQPDTLKHPEQFLFPRFSKGRIAMKAGKEIEVLLNYNVISEKIVFVDKGKILGIGNPGSVDTVYLNGRKLVPVGKVYYELLSAFPVTLFAQYKGTVQQPPKMDPYGRASESASTTSINKVNVGWEFYLLTDQELVIKKETVYWISINNALQSFRDANQFLKIFPDFKNEIKSYIKQNKTKFVNTDEVLKLTIYCKGLMKGA
jgi:hypothetical protein